MEHHNRLPLDTPLPDPFCIRTADGYYLTGSQSTPPGPDGMVFNMFFSKDLRHWSRLSALLDCSSESRISDNNYWAPELFRFNDRWYCTYTADVCGDPYRRFIRMAVADTITGPYTDLGITLSTRPSIDSHVCVSPAQSLYLFYTGNEGNNHVGQVLIDSLLSPEKAAGSPIKAFPDETVEWEEGTFAVFDQGRYYLFTSMGNWRDKTYHIRVATSEHITGPYQRIMQDGVPYRLLGSEHGFIGPGHCSLFRDHEERLFICFHAWDKERTGRFAHIARVDMRDAGRPRIIS